LNGRRLKHVVLDLLKSGELFQRLGGLKGANERRVLNVLFSTLISQEEEIKWRSVTAIGTLVAELAEKDMESARNMMRRLMWSLNDESGGIGWGAPECMGEIMARHEGMANDYVHILISYTRKDGNFLDYEPLQRGLVWGIGRLSQVRPHLVRSANGIRPLLPHLDSGDATIKGLTAWTLGLLAAAEARSGLENLVREHKEIKLYQDGHLHTRLVSDLAREALDRISKNAPAHLATRGGPV
jgi:hypothetical protein